MIRWTVKAGIPAIECRHDTILRDVLNIRVGQEGSNRFVIEIPCGKLVRFRYTQLHGGVDEPEKAL